MKTIVSISLTILIIALAGCKEEIITPLEEPIIPVPKSYSLELNTDSEFPVGHNLGLNYYNDITVGVINNEPGNYQLITAAGTSSYILKGNSLKELSELTLVAEADPDAFYTNYVGLGQLIQDPQGIIYSVFHAEQHDGTILPGNIPGFYASVGLGISSDGGVTFELDAEPLIQNTYDISYDNGYGDGGLGESSITYSKDSTEVFVYYVDHNRSGRGVNICMARFDVFADGTPDFSTCYYLNENNEFTNSTIRSKEVVAGTGYADAIFPHVSYNSFIDKYVMVYSLNHYGEFHNGSSTPSASGIYYRLSDDGISWRSMPVKLITDWSIPYSYDEHSFVWHPNIIYSNDEQSEGYLLYSKAITLQEGHKMWAMDFVFTEE